MASAADRRLSYNARMTGVFIQYHRDLINSCRLKRYDLYQGTSMDDLEVLAALQHKGAATCLLDFTRNPLIALWFACGPLDPDKHGKVFIVDTADTDMFVRMTHENKQNERIEDILRFSTVQMQNQRPVEQDLPISSTSLMRPDPASWIWAPETLNMRTVAQHSLFIFPSIGTRRSPATELVKELVIDANSKRSIRRELEELYNIREETLFPDFAGFALTQRHNAPYSAPDDTVYRRHARDAYQSLKFDDAIRHLNTAIELNGSDYELYNLRGLAHFWLRQLPMAVSDLSRAIELKTEDPVLHYNRGEAFYGQKMWEESIDDFSKAISIDPDNEAYYSFRGSARESSGDINGALSDFETATRLNPESGFLYFRRGILRLISREWDGARADLKLARSREGPIIPEMSQWTNERISEFEQKYGIELPPDVRKLLNEGEHHPPD